MSGLKSVLVLEDGTVIRGRGFGAEGNTAVGEVVFNTSMVGYTEMLTDPSYRGQILMFTYPLVGNYAIPPDFESSDIQAGAMIMREACREPHHWQSGKTIVQWAEETNTPAMEGVDTRMLMKKIRNRGVMNGALAVYKKGNEPDIEGMTGEAKKYDIDSMDLVRSAAVQEPEEYMVGGKQTIVLLDCGTKMNIIRELNGMHMNVVAVPPWSQKEIIDRYEPAGILISNGPGNPKSAPYLQDVIKKIRDDYPIFAICLGHQAVALAFGADTYKLKFGHRGANHPVKDIDTGRVYITSQNHGYAVSEESLEGTGFRVSKVNINDGSVEGITHEELPIFSVQYHPEAAPGPKDSKYLFDRFLEVVGGCN